MTTLGLYRPGDSLFHRLSPGPKLLLLLAMSIVQIVWRDALVSLALLALAFVLVAISGIGLMATLRSLRLLLLSLALLAGYHYWVNGPARAATVIGGLLAVVLVATVVTATTRVDDLLDFLTRLLGPVRRIGISPDRIALTISLVLRMVPTTLDLAAETSAAAKARGLDHSLRARLVPFVIRVVARARSTGDALVARGIGDD